jgi:hypothetical protein
MEEGVAAQPIADLDAYEKFTTERINRG